ncbi:hypothetical protein CPS_1823 [Colwellia psychrerythraea 34H]|uniref:Uncharacterized protein n=1 Tax=Colwellia psychrerythraea (strain 34H / ATCC BAA-681) TaxID=167879 RepID=Q484G2_COLP3|nr:hypothetical protein CPS_1823 [Colwellia psychrerythraea 34H]
MKSKRLDKTYFSFVIALNGSELNRFNLGYKYDVK